MLIVTFSAGLPVEKREEVKAEFFKAFARDVSAHVDAAMKELDELDRQVRAGEISVDIARTKLHNVMNRHAGGDT